MYGQSNAILDPKTGETLMYSELLKGNRVTMPSGYTMHPQSGKLHVDNGEDINLVELLLQSSSGGQDGTDEGSEKEWNTLINKTLDITEGIKSINLTSDYDLSLFEEIIVYAEISKNTNPDYTGNTTFTGINYGGMNFCYYSFATVTNSVGKNIYLRLYPKKPIPYSMKVEMNVNLSTNVQAPVQMSYRSGAVTNNNIKIDCNNEYIGNVKIQIYGR